MFTKEQEAYIDHEVRIRSNEGTIKDIKETMIRLEGKMDSHFKWMLSTMLLMILTLVTFMVTIKM